MPSIGREFGSVFLGDKNIAALVVSEGWAKVRCFLELCLGYPFLLSAIFPWYH